jgi:hypothetical protein
MRLIKKREMIQKYEAYKKRENYYVDLLLVDLWLSYIHSCEYLQAIKGSSLLCVHDPEFMQEKMGADGFLWLE